MKRKLRVFTLLGAMALIVPIARGLVRPPAAIPEPRYEEGWDDMFSAQKSLVTYGDYELVFIGDSITEYWADEGKEAWDQYYGDRNALNLGIGGDRTESVLWRVNHLPLEHLRPKVAVLMIGVNNYKWSDAYGISEGIKAIVHRLQEAWPDTQILVMGILPGDVSYSPMRKVMADASERIQHWVDNRNVHYLNINRRFENHHHDHRPGIMKDLLHLSPKGYEAWAEAMEPTLALLLGDASKVVPVEPAPQIPVPFPLAGI